MQNFDVGAACALAGMMMSAIATLFFLYRYGMIGLAQRRARALAVGGV